MLWILSRAIDFDINGDGKSFCILANENPLQGPNSEELKLTSLDLSSYQMAGKKKTERNGERGNHRGFFSVDLIKI